MTTATPPAPVVVRLTPREYHHAARVGFDRSVQNVRKGARPRYGAPADRRYDYSVQGAIAEYIVARHLGIFWDGALGDYAASDVGGYEVRSSPRADAHLPLHPPDRDEAPFILVTGTDYTWTIRGWVLGRDGKAARYWGDLWKKQRPAFWVPQADLQPVDTLPDRKEAPA